MKNQEKILKELEIKMDTVIIKYENIFRTSNVSGQDFLNVHYDDIRSELASLSTNTIHQAIMLEIVNEQKMIFSIRKLNFKSICKLIRIIKGANTSYDI